MKQLFNAKLLISRLPSFSVPKLVLKVALLTRLKVALLTRLKVAPKMAVPISLKPGDRSVKRFKTKNEYY